MSDEQGPSKPNEEKCLIDLTEEGPSAPDESKKRSRDEDDTLLERKIRKIFVEEQIKKEVSNKIQKHISLATLSKIDRPAFINEVNKMLGTNLMNYISDKDIVNLAIKYGNHK